MTPHLTLSRMMINSVICCLLYATWTIEANLTVEGFEGEDISFQCTHKNAWYNSKYLCKDPCTKSDHIQVTVNSGERQTAGKVTLADSGDGTFTVTFSQLQRSDSGTYWCGVARTGLDTFNKIHLVVKETIAQQTTLGTEVSSQWVTHSDSTVTQLISLMEIGTTCSQGNEEELGISSTGTLFYVTGGTVAMVIATVLLVIYFRKWRENSKPQACSNNIYIVTATERKQADCDYEEVSDEVQPNIKLSEMASCTHNPKMDPLLPKSTEATCSSPFNVYGNICCDKTIPECSYSVVDIQEKCDVDASIMDLPPKASDIATLVKHVKHTSNSADVRNANRRCVKSCASKMAPAHSKSCCGPTETSPGPVWFGLDLSAAV